MEEEIKKLIRSVLHQNGNIFDNLIMAMYRYTTHSVSSLSEMKKVQTTKAKGDFVRSTMQINTREATLS